MSPTEKVKAVLSRYTEFFLPEALEAESLSNPSGRKTLVLMTPKQFQKLAFPLSYGEKHKAKTARTDEHAGQWHELPYLRIKIDFESDEALVIGHEGRHRTIYMQSRDLNRIPVMLWVSQTRKTKLGDKMLWGTTSYRPKLLRSQNEKWVMPMPHSIAFPKIE